MAYPSLAIIGTAGRKEDKAKLTVYHYDRMLQAVANLINECKMEASNLRVISGGAAWADHLAVHLALTGLFAYDNLTLYMPTPLGEGGYYGTTDRESQTADTANYYHKAFSDVVGFSSIGHIRAAGDRGAHLIPGNGSFHARNALVAKAVTPDGALVAFTFGAEGSGQTPWTAKMCGPEVTADQAGLKDGGTAHTWNTAKCTKFHALIGAAGPVRVYTN